MNFLECNLGFTYQSEDVLIFFGKIGCTMDNLIEHFSNYDFYKIKQTHSDIVIEGSSQVAEADAHWTSEINKALVVLTADCTPILIHNRISKCISAIHAGWRGVEKEILLKTLLLMQQKNNVASAFEIWIGPHILQDSFAVDLDVLNQLLASYKGANAESVFYKENIKYYVNLSEILRSQVNAALTSMPQLNFLMADTLTDPRFNSFRRDKNLSGRNISFIVRLK